MKPQLHLKALASSLQGLFISDSDGVITACLNMVNLGEKRSKSYFILGDLNDVFPNSKRSLEWP
ncbi:MAG: hypothetical protein HP060_01420 [Opitutales bacterium]|nr:hypothetical protein [Opitutales bacterium]